MSISEQVRELRGNSVELNRQPYMQRILKQAADTIESLSAKLQAANKELERWHTDHINEKIKNPFAYTSTLICHNCDHKDEYIEELESEIEELQAANMERSADCGGWIYCGDGKNAPKKDGDYWITYTYESCKHSIKCVGTSAFKNGKFSRKGINIIAWMPCNVPEPYHEP